MRSRYALVVVAGWAVVVMPTTCMGGWLRHACAHTCHSGHACDETETRDAAPPPGEEHQDNCGHESGCLTDPCAQAVRLDEDSGARVVPAPDQVISFGCPLVGASRAVSPLRVDRRVHPPDSRHLKGRPYPDPDIPLLI